jgi:type I restriction enzyme S subunit
MNRHVRYPVYVPAEATALTELPKSWVTKRMRFVCEVNPSKSKNPLPDGTLVSFVPMEAVGEYGGLALTAEKAIEDIGTGYTYFEDGDVIVAKITPCFENGKGALAKGLTGGVAFGTTELHILRAGETLDPRFLFYASISEHFRKFGESEMYGAGGQKRVPEAFLKDFRLGIPPRIKQQAICDALDQEVGRLDSIRTKKENLIELLSEKRVAVITLAVTRGLDRSAPTTDSRISWLGHIPQHWRIRRIKFVVSHVVDCLHTTPHYDGELRFPSIRTADVDRGHLLLEQARLVSEDVYRERIERLQPRAGDILYSREGERFGFAALVPSGVELCLGQRMMMFRALSDMDPTFLMWALNSEPIYQQVQLFSGGATSPHVNIGDIINFWVACPPINEQREISKHIDAVCAQLDRLIVALWSDVKRIVEFRSGLITGAVTGKIDVCSNQRQEAAE